MSGYDIAVKISLIENVTRGLTAMSGAFAKTGAEAKKIQEAMNNIGGHSDILKQKLAGMYSNHLASSQAMSQADRKVMSDLRERIRMTQHLENTEREAHQKRLQQIQAEQAQKHADINNRLMTGGLLVGAGAAGLASLKHPYEQAAEYERSVLKLRQMGLGDLQIQDAEKHVKATEIIGTSINDRMRLFAEAQGSFRESGKSGAEALQAAKAMLPILGEYETATQVLGGKHQHAAEGSMRNLNKIIEMMGGLNDINRAKAIADGVFKTAQSSGRMVDERQLQQFFAYGSSATNQQNLRTVFGGLEPIIGMMKGSTVATGMRTAYTRVNGMMAGPPKNMVHELQRLGLADAGEKKQRAELTQLQATDMVGYVQKVMQQYESHGITSRTAREQENQILFGTNGAKVINEIMQTMPTILHSLEAYDKSQGTSQVMDNPEAKRLVAMQEAHKKWDDLMLTIGQSGGLLEMATTAVQSFTTGIKAITEFAQAHPTLTKFAVGMFALVSALAMVGGTILLVTASFRALGLVLSLLKGFGKGGGMWGKAKKVTSAGGGLAKSAGSTAMSAGKKALELLGKAARSMASSVSAAARVLGTGLRMAGTGLRVVGRVAVFALQALGRAILFAGRALLMNPIGLVLTAIAIAAYLLYRNWSTIKPKLIAVWNSIRSAAISVWNSIRSALINAWNAIRSAALAVWNAIKAVIIAAWNAIKSVISGAMSSAQGIVNSGFSAIVSAISNWIGQAVAAVQSALGAVGSAIGGMMSRAGAAVKSGINTIARGAGGHSYDGSRGRVMA